MRLEIEGVRDCPIKEAKHVAYQLVGIVEEHIVPTPLQLENLRLPTREMSIVLHDSLRTLRRSEEVASPIYECDGEGKIL